MSPDKDKKRKLKEKGKVDEKIIKELKAQEKRRKSKLNLKKRRKRDKENGVRLVEDDELSLKDDDTVVEVHNEDFGGERKSLEKKKKKKSKLSLKTKRSRDVSNEVDTNPDDQLSLKINDAMVEINHEDFDGIEKSPEKKRKKKKSKLGLKMKRDRENASKVDSNSCDRVSADEDVDDGTMHQKGKKEKKHKKKETNISTERKKEETLGGADKWKVDEISSVDEDCSRGMRKKGKKEKKHKKKETNISTERKKEEKLCGADKWKVDEISSVDEDCSRGMKKWLIKYKESRTGLNILQQRIDDYITAYEEQQQQEKKEREAKAAEGGWTVVVHHKGRKKTTDIESGVTVGSVSQSAVVDKMGKKKSKEVPLDFYRFQKREAHRNEVMLLQSKFEQDKKRIQQLRAARKFRPY